MTIEGQIDAADATPPKRWLRVEGIAMSTGPAIRRIYDKSLGPLGLTLPHAMLLAYVVQVGPHTQSQLARALDSGRAVTGWRIDELVQRGAVERRLDPLDKRVWVINATDTGRELAAAIGKVDQQIRERIRRGTSREDRLRFVAVALEMRKNIDEALLEDFMPVLD